MAPVAHHVAYQSSSRSLFLGVVGNYPDCWRSCIVRRAEPPAGTRRLLFGKVLSALIDRLTGKRAKQPIANRKLDIEILRRHQRGMVGTR